VFPVAPIDVAPIDVAPIDVAPQAVSIASVDSIPVSGQKYPVGYKYEDDSESEAY
jgi:hypothetical protein